MSKITNFVDDTELEYKTQLNIERNEYNTTKLELVIWLFDNMTVQF